MDRGDVHENEQEVPPLETLAGNSEAGYREPVAVTAFCTSCQRTVYIEDGETPVCPVCSSPLLETVERGEDEERAPSQ